MHDFSLGRRESGAQPDEGSVEGSGTAVAESMVARVVDRGEGHKAEAADDGQDELASHILTLVCHVNRMG